MRIFVPRPFRSTGGNAGPIPAVSTFQVKELEEKLENEALHKEIHTLRQQLELLEEDKKELEQKFQSSEEKARNLKHSGESPQQSLPCKLVCCLLLFIYVIACVRAGACAHACSCAYNVDTRDQLQELPTLFSFLNMYFYFMCISILLACMSIHHVCP